MANDKLKMVPLGGLGEFGMNSMAIRYGDEIIVIDAGMMFPDAELLGVDIVTPDFAYLEQHREKVKALILTHGHEDHIGGLPWILSELKVPVYATEFTLAYVEGKLEEHHLLDQIDLVEAPARDQGARRAHVRVQLEFLAQAHIGTAVAAPRGCLERTLEGQARAPDALERRLR